MNSNSKEIKHHVPNYFLNPSHPIGIIVAGIGGTGCIVASNLLKMHVTLKALDHIGLKVFLCDGSDIRPANQGRQEFYKDDIGKNKAYVLSARLNAAVGEYVFIPITEDVSKSTLNGSGWGYNKRLGINANIIIGCVDNIESREIFQWSMRKRRVAYDEDQLWYWMDCGNDFNSGQVILGSKLIHQPKGSVTRAKLPTAMEMMPEAIARIDDEDDTPSCSLAEAIDKQDMFINSTIADVGCHLLWNLLKDGFVTYNAVFVNLLTGEIGRNKL